MIKTYNDNSNKVSFFGAQANGIGTMLPFDNGHPITPVLPNLTQLTPIQILGLIPLLCCNNVPFTTSGSFDGSFDPSFETGDDTQLLINQCDCRTWPDDDCYINPVFASPDPVLSRENDRTLFMLEYPVYYQHVISSVTMKFYLDTWNGIKWVQVAILNDNTYGAFYDYKNLCVRMYSGYLIYWQTVLQNIGEGLYRFRVVTSILNAESCLASPPFCLKVFSCKAADKTVKWEAIVDGGRMGSIDDDTKLFTFCCDEPKFGTLRLYDSVRHYGFFGYEKTEYERVNYEYMNGEIVEHKNEAVQTFEYHSGRMPKYLHDRFKSYGIMADKLFVTDYNMSNSDYDVEKKVVICDGGYAPEYVITNGENRTRLSHVIVKFKEGIQNVIRDKCCDVIGQIIPT